MRIFLCFVAIFPLLSPMNAQGITCYKCRDRMCTKFDEGVRFKVDCPNSTMCMKRTSYLSLNKWEKKKLVQRDCAPQTYNYQKYNQSNSKWTSANRINTSAYKEGCSLHVDSGAPTTAPEYCFCSYHLCNGYNSNRTIQSLGLIIGLVVCIMQNSRF